MLICPNLWSIIGVGLQRSGALQMPEKEKVADSAGASLSREMAHLPANTDTRLTHEP